MAETLARVHREGESAGSQADEHGPVQGRKQLKKGEGRRREGKQWRIRIIRILVVHPSVWLSQRTGVEIAAVSSKTMLTMQTCQLSTGYCGCPLHTAAPSTEYRALVGKIPLTSLVLGCLDAGNRCGQLASKGFDEPLTGFPPSIV